MAQFLMPCPNPVACPGSDVAVLNLSSEQPDAIRYFGFKFFGDQWGLCITTDPELAALCDLPFPTNPPALVLSSSTPQTCTVPCDGIPVSYTAVAGSFVAATQSDADIQAFALACLVAQIICDGGTVTIFTNTAQTCSVPCAGGGVSTITIPVGVASGLAQVDANNAALALACVVADFLCNQNPVPEGIPPFGGAGSSIPSFYFRNTQQSCAFPCADGQSIFTHTIPGGLFYGASPAAANAVAQSFACNRSLVTPACLDNIVTDLCENAPYADIITVTEFTSPSWAIVSGLLPLGLFFNGGIISGSPVETGEFTFRVRASQGADYVERSYTFSVKAITTASPLPNGTVGDPYAVALAETGFDSPTWAITSGAIPSGLSFNPNNGILNGTPDTGSEGSYSFTISATEGAVSCDKAFTLTIEDDAAALDWDTLFWEPFIGPTFTQVALAAGSAASGSASGNSGNGSATSGTPIAPPSGDYTSFFAAKGSLTYTGPAQNAQATVNYAIATFAASQTAQVTLFIQVDGNPVLTIDWSVPPASGTDIQPFTIPLSVGALIEVFVIVSTENSQFAPAGVPTSVGSFVIVNV